MLRERVAPVLPAERELRHLYGTSTFGAVQYEYDASLHGAVWLLRHL